MSDSSTSCSSPGNELCSVWAKKISRLKEKLNAVSYMVLQNKYREYFEVVPIFKIELKYYKY